MPVALRVKSPKEDTISVSTRAKDEVRRFWMTTGTAKRNVVFQKGLSPR